MPKTLLLADDSVTIQKVVGISFANEDVVLLTVDNGDDAIARAKEARPDVVLADVVMPGKNGYEVCQAIKADPALAGTPVLLLTGTFEAFDEQRAARAGADGHITKPFEAQSLVDKVNALLARDRGKPAAEPAPARVEIGVLRPVQVAPPPPPPVSHTAETAYDFFDDEVTAPRPAAAPPEEATTVLLGAAPAPAPADDGFGFDAADFESPEPAPAPPAAAEPAVPAAPAAPSAAPRAEVDWSAPLATGGLESIPSFGGEDLGFETAPGGRGAPEESASLFDDGFPLSGADPEPEPGPDVRAETRLLGDPFEVAAEPFDPGVTRMAEPAPAPAPAPLDALDELDLDGGLESPASFGDAVFDPTGARDYDVSSSDLGSPLAGTAPPRESTPAPEPPPAAWAAAWPEVPEALEPPAPAAPAPAAYAGPPADALDAAAGSASLGRDELRDMLEKMAWEAFGPLTERLVRDAVDRIERVAWEVIPQLAETLIREEIRKLKGE